MTEGGLISDAFRVGSGRYCPPRHRMPFDVKKRGYKLRWMTWQAESAKPYGLKSRAGNGPPPCRRRGQHPPHLPQVPLEPLLRRLHQQPGAYIRSDFSST